MTTQWKTRNKS